MTFAIEGIQAVLHEIVESHPAGLSEHDLLKELAERDVGFFNEDYFQNILGLFQRHFLLFHCLYRLRDKLRVSRQGDLTIHCLGIQLTPYVSTPSDHPVLPDALADYYLNLDNLASSDETDVLYLLDGFWGKIVADDQRDEALAVMQLAHPVSYSAIRRQYRCLAMQWHPDRGGEPEQFQRLEWAMKILRVLYR